MIDWKQYGPIYTVAPGIKKLGDLPIIEFDNQEERYLNLKKKFMALIVFQDFPNIINMIISNIFWNYLKVKKLQKNIMI